MLIKQLPDESAACPREVSDTRAFGIGISTTAHQKSRAHRFANVHHTRGILWIIPNRHRSKRIRRWHDKSQTESSVQVAQLVDRPRGPVVSNAKTHRPRSVLQAASRASSAPQAAPENQPELHRSEYPFAWKSCQNFPFQFGERTPCRFPERRLWVRSERRWESVRIRIGKAPNL